MSLTVPEMVAISSEVVVSTPPLGSESIGGRSHPAADRADRTCDQEREPAPRDGIKGTFRIPTVGLVLVIMGASSFSKQRQ